MQLLVAWGGHADHSALAPLVREVKAKIKSTKPSKVWCLGTTASGQPCHPLMLPYSTKLEEFAL